MIGFALGHKSFVAWFHADSGEFVHSIEATVDGMYVNLDSGEIADISSDTELQQVVLSKPVLFSDMSVAQLQGFLEEDIIDSSDQGVDVLPNGTIVCVSGDYSETTLADLNQSMGELCDKGIGLSFVLGWSEETTVEDYLKWLED